MPSISFLNPRSDATFVRTVESILASPITTASELELRLRERYPAAVVRERDMSGEQHPVWYVYRDGGWVPEEG